MKTCYFFSSHGIAPLFVAVLNSDAAVASVGSLMTVVMWCLRYTTWKTTTSRCFPPTAWSPSSSLTTLPSSRLERRAAAARTACWSATVSRSTACGWSHRVTLRLTWSCRSDGPTVWWRRTCRHGPTVRRPASPAMHRVGQKMVHRFIHQ